MFPSVSNLNDASMFVYLKSFAGMVRCLAPGVCQCIVAILDSAPFFVITAYPSLYFKILVLLSQSECQEFLLLMSFGF